MLGVKDEVRKALVTLAIEKALLDVGKPIYDEVMGILKKKYNCYLPDCYEHPEYLEEILKGLYGNAHKAIVESINRQLEEFSYHEPIARFLKVVCK